MKNGCRISMYSMSLDIHLGHRHFYTLLHLIYSRPHFRLHRRWQDCVLVLQCFLRPRFIFSCLISGYRYWFYRVGHNALTETPPDNPSVTCSTAGIGCTAAEVPWVLYCTTNDKIAGSNKNDSAQILGEIHFTACTGYIVFKYPWRTIMILRMVRPQLVGY